MSRLFCDSLLIVDDNEAALRVTSSLFREEGYEVVPCRDPQEAISMLGVVDFDAVLSDINMPLISGIQLLKKIHDINPGIPVILMTGHAELAMAIAAVKNDAFDFITKPFQPEYIVESVKRAIAFRKTGGLKQ